MKVVDLATLRAMPIGTLFQKTEPNCLYDIEMFEGPVGDLDFCSTHLDSLVDPHGISNMMEFGASEPIDLESITRDACHDADQKFAVWEKDDLRALIARLQKLIDG
jgi:hypothetical protein